MNNTTKLIYLSSFVTLAIVSCKKDTLTQNNNNKKKKRLLL